ncbi:transposase, partial [Candidatus Bathyarchaeota archaeon]|nr:transposase [Candidatus Bathyarchaeota archaeon]
RRYQVIITDLRLILYAQRGLIFKRDDLLTERMDKMIGMKYEEKGKLGKKGSIRVEGETTLFLVGGVSEIKALYQSLLPFLTGKPIQMPPPPPQPQQIYCPACGNMATFISQYQRYYCYSCKQYVEIPPPP